MPSLRFNQPVRPVTFRPGSGMRPGLLPLERLTLMEGLVENQYDIYKWKKNKLVYRWRPRRWRRDQQCGIPTSTMATLSSPHGEDRESIGLAARRGPMSSTIPVYATAPRGEANGAAATRGRDRHGGSLAGVVVRLVR